MSYKLKPGQTQQFGTFDNLEDRRELRYLMEQLGSGLPEPQAMRVRAEFLERLVSESIGALAACPVKVDASECRPHDAYNLFVAIVGVLEVPIDDAAELLTQAVRTRYWLPRSKLILDPVLLDAR